MFSMLAQTPDTSGYMLAGYAVFIALPLVFIASLIYRYRNLKQDETALRSLDEGGGGG